MATRRRTDQEWGLLERAYAAFNARDISGALAGMHRDIDWPNGMVQHVYTIDDGLVRAMEIRQP